MRKRIIMVLILLIIFLLTMMIDFVNARAIGQAVSFTSGNDYIEKLSETEKWTYVKGLHDMYSRTLFVMNPEKYLIFEEKTEDMTLRQLTKILNKYLEKYPENLHYDAASCFIWALDEIMDK